MKMVNPGSVFCHVRIFEGHFCSCLGSSWSEGYSKRTLFECSLVPRPCVRWLPCTSVVHISGLTLISALENMKW